MGHIFISYSKKDIVYAEKLINALRREGFDPWVDMEGLGAGTHWQTRLLERIQTCDAYLLVMSHNALKSKWVPDELVTAKSLGKPIFPLLLEDTELFLALQTIQYEDVRGGKLPSEEFYQRLAEATPRQKKARRRKNSTDKARKQVVEGTSQLASFYWGELSSKGKEFITAASKKSSETFKSLASSDVVKRLSSTVGKNELPEEKRSTPKKTSSTAKKASATKRTSSTNKKASSPKKKKKKTTRKKTTTK